MQDTDSDGFKRKMSHCNQKGKLFTGRLELSTFGKLMHKESSVLVTKKGNIIT